MGNTSCADLQQYQDACEIAPCVANILGLPSNSNSPTDTWILTFHEGTRYDKVPIHSAFMKWWVNSASISRLVGSGSEPLHLQKDIKGLDYEIKVYRDIIRPLIDYDICPNFVRFLGSGNGCTLEQLVSMIHGTVKSLNGKVLSKKTILYNLQRNITYIVDGISNRPSINNPTVYHKDIIPWHDMDKLLYNTLINENILPGTQSFWEWQNGLCKRTELFPRQFLEVIFQVIAGCYAMSLSRMTHNDIHTGNVWVSRYTEGTERIYILDNITYTLNSAYTALIYDFDRAYVESIGNNGCLVGRLCSMYNQCNRFSPNRDAIKFLAYAYKWTTNSTNRKMILDIIAPESQQRFMKRVLDNNDWGVYLVKHGNTNKLMDSDDLGKLRQLEGSDGILHRVAVLAGIEVGKRNLDTNNVYVCNPDLFDNAGRIRVKSSAATQYREDHPNDQSSKKKPQNN